MKLTTIKGDQKNGISGFTMVEMLVAISAFTLLVVAFVPLFKTGSDYWQATQSQTELRQSLNSALQFMSAEIRQADPQSIQINPGENVLISYTVSKNGTTEQRSFRVRQNGSKPVSQLEYFRNGEWSFITPGTVNIVTRDESTTSVRFISPLYKITLTGKYAIPNAISDTEKSLTVETSVAPRAEG